MKELVMVKYGEIILKGLNRPVFENMLMKNIRKALGDDIESMECRQAVIYIIPKDGADMDELCEKLTKVFGIVYFTFVVYFYIYERAAVYAINLSSFLVCNVRIDY